MDAQISSIALWETVGKGMVGIGCTQKAYVLQTAADALQVDARKQASGRGGSRFWLGTLFDLRDKNSGPRGSAAPVSGTRKVQRDHDCYASSRFLDYPGTPAGSDRQGRRGLKG